MTAQGRYAAPDSSFGRSAGNAAARGGALIAVAVLIGFLLLWQGGVGGSGDEVTAGSGTETDDSADATNDAETDDPGTETEDPGTETDDTGTEDAVTEDTVTETDDGSGTETTETTAPATTRPPGEVKAAVANGVSEAGLAGARAGVLSTAGYVTAAVNAAADTATSAVYYVDGYSEDALAIATELGGDASVLRPLSSTMAELVRDTNAADVDGFHVLVLLGTDRVLG